MAGALLPLGLACTAEIPGAAPPAAAGSNSGGSAGAGGSAVVGPSSDAIGQGVVRRLTRAQYNNTVRDLVGTTLRPADTFPGDVGADGFDNASGPQTVVAAHLSAFETGAFDLVEAAFADPTQRARLVACDLTAPTCVRQSLEAFVPRAWRRPVAADEIDRLMALAQAEATAGGSAEEQLKLAIRGALLSPHFMYLIEKDPDPTSPASHPVTSHELASRLSYFLWSSMPDQPLLDAAAAGTLQDNDVLVQQLTRMLGDPKASALIDDFAGQWLQLTKLPTHEPKADVFPEATPALKQAMTDETKAFFREVLQTGASLRTLVAADFTFLDGSLAAHYGLTPPAAAGFVRSSVAGTTRLGGLLGQGSILMLTSGLTKTSAVKRGSWVLDNLLCTPPPAPPPDVMAELVEKQQELEAQAESLSQRQFLEIHRAEPKCAVCHQLIDPVGLALENYDAIGRYRTTDHGAPVDPSGVMIDGTAFTTPSELTAILAADPALARCVSRKLFTFALGRSPGSEDAAHVERLALSNDTTLTAVLSELILSAPFRYRRGGQGALP